MKRVVVGLLILVVLVFVVSGLAGEEVKALSYGADGNPGSASGLAEVGGAQLQPLVEAPAYLPLLTSNYCPDFYDDFSNPGTGWDVSEDDYVRSEYLDGEYRVLSKKSGYIYLYPAPACWRSDYVVEVDARWVGQPGFSYGIFFGLIGDYEHFYFVEVNADYSMFWVFRYGPAGFVELGRGQSTAIKQGGASNHIKIGRQGDAINLEVNGSYLGAWNDGTIGGLTGYGVVSSPYDEVPVSDARFDNFAVSSIETAVRDAGQSQEGQSGQGAGRFFLETGSIGPAVERKGPPESRSQSRH